MAGTGHIYVTAHGEFTGYWAGETAQVGLRVLFRNIGGESGPVIQVPDLGAPTMQYNTYDSTLFNVVEQFNQQLPGMPGLTTEVMEDIATDVRTFLNAIRAQQATNFRWTHIKIAPIERGTGKYLAPSSIYTFKTAIAGTGASPLPPEVAVAVSLRAGIVGKRGRGRIYIPGLTANVTTSDGILGSTAKTNLSGSMHTLVKAIEDQPGLDTMDTKVVVMSAQSTTAVVPAEVRVGEHLDAQRRRQHQVSEGYTIVPL